LNPWLETVGVILVALVGIYLGRRFSRLKNPYWTIGYFLSLSLLAILVMTIYNEELLFLPPFSWLTAGRVRFVVLCLAATMGLTTPLSRLSRKFEKVTIAFLMVVVVTWFSVFPFLFPALIQNRLTNLKTRINAEGICFQTTDYTCGPAAAVTALTKLGLTANEGEIAVLSRTSPMAGTLPDCLYRAIQNRYGDDGLKCQYRHFDSVKQLKNTDVALAVVKQTFLLNHCVAVLEVSDSTVTVADPAFGRRSMSHEQFEKVWSFSGITMTRDTAPKMAQSI
jgi:hypothetical protein